LTSPESNPMTLAMASAEGRPAIDASAESRTTTIAPSAPPRAPAEAKTSARPDSSMPRVSIHRGRSGARLSAKSTREPSAAVRSTMM
jgi:hypothetical protein